MAIVQVLDKSFIGEGLNAPKIYRVDPIESTGSLLLFDASKFVHGGALVNNLVVPNLMNNNAKKLTGADSHMFLQANITPGQSKLERSAKGGIHYIPNYSLDFGENEDSSILRGSGGVKEYMRLHAAATDDPHTFLIFIWHRLTSQQQIDTSLGIQGYEQNIYPSNYCFDTNYNIEYSYYMIMGVNAGITTYRNYTDSMQVSGSSTPYTSTNMNLYCSGRAGLNRMGSHAKKYASSMIYRVYIEDLTVSGRTEEEVVAIDQTLYNAAFAVGGKFHNDTWTNPLTAFTS